MEGRRLAGGLGGGVIIVTQVRRNRSLAWGGQWALLSEESKAALALLRELLLWPLSAE